MKLRKLFNTTDTTYYVLEIDEKHSFLFAHGEPVAAQLNDTAIICDKREIYNVAIYEFFGGYAKSFFDCVIFIKDSKEVKNFLIKKEIK